MGSLVSAQHFRLSDTIVVFKLDIGFLNGMTKQYIPFKTKSTVKWSDTQNVIHRSVIRGINSRYLVLDATRVYTSNIVGLDLSPSAPGFFPTQFQRAIPVIIDSSGRFNIMSYYDFRILLKTISYSAKPQQLRGPFFNKLSSERFTAHLQRKKQRRIERFAALDTCPLHYGIKTDLVRDLINEINLSIELPVKRSFCIDVGGGVLYTRPDANSGGYDRAFAQFGLLKSDNQFWFDHSYYNRKGFGLEVIPKFFITKNKNIYVGPQLGFRYYNYHDKWIFMGDDGSDDYYRAYYAYQSEKSASIQLNAIFGVQTPQIKRFLFDAFVSFGFMYRGGTVSRTIENTYFHYYGTKTDTYGPPLTFKGGGFSLAGQIGFRIGFRFAKAILFKRK